MNRRDCCILLGATLLCPGPGRAAGELAELYSLGRLSQERPRLEARIGELYQVLRGQILRNGASPNEQRLLQTLRIDFPNVYADGWPLNFGADMTSSGPLVIMPLLSLLFLEDLCTAYAWLERYGYSLETIDQYMAMLRHKPAVEFPGSRYPPPLQALGIPPGAADDREAGPLGLRFRNSAYGFILAHEIGHVLLGHRGYRSVSKEQARHNEAEADDFALRLLSSAATIPMSAVLYFQAQAFMESNPGLFAAQGRGISDWDAAMRTEITHPLTAERLQAMAVRLYEQSGQPRAHAERETLLYIAVRLGTIAETLADRDQQQCMAVAARRATMADLALQRPGPSERFLGKCVRRNR